MVARKSRRREHAGTDDSRTAGADHALSLRTRAEEILGRREGADRERRPSVPVGLHCTGRKLRRCGGTVHDAGEFVAAAMKFCLGTIRGWMVLAGFALCAAV